MILHGYQGLFSPLRHQSAGILSIAILPIPPKDQFILLNSNGRYACSDSDLVETQLHAATLKDYSLLLDFAFPVTFFPFAPSFRFILFALATSFVNPKLLVSF